MHRPGHISADGAYLALLISVAYQISTVRIINNLGKDLPEFNKPYWVSAIAPPGREDTLYPLFQQFPAATFGLYIKREIREKDVFTLTIPKDKPAILQPSKSTGPARMTVRGKVTAKRQGIKTLAELLEVAFSDL